MSSQGFVGGLMQGYDFMDDRYNRKAQNERLARQEDRQDKRLGMQEEAHEIEKMQRERADEARKIQAVQYKMQNQVPLSEDEQKIVDRYAGDERTQRFMQKVEKDPRKVYSAADSILRGVKGEASKTDVINASNYLFDSWIGQGDGKNKRISDLKPIDGKIYAELEYDDEETGERVTGAPLTYRRKKSDSVVRDLDAGKAVEAAQMMKALAAERIRLGDNTPIQQQAAADKRRAELGLAAWKRQNEVEDRELKYQRELEQTRLDNKTKKEIARIKNDAEKNGLGEYPEHMTRSFRTETKDPVSGEPTVVTDELDEANFIKFATLNADRFENWDQARAGYAQYKEQLKQQEYMRGAQIAAEDIMNMDPYKARNALNNLPDDKRALVQRLLPQEFWQQFDGEKGNAKTVKQRTYPEQQRLTYKQMTPEQIAKQMANKSDKYVQQQLESFVEPEKAARVMELIPQARKVDRNSFKGGLYNMAEKLGFDPR